MLCERDRGDLPHRPLPQSEIPLGASLSPGFVVVTLNSSSLLVNGIADPLATWAEAVSWKGLLDA